MKRIKKLQGHTSTKYGKVLTKEESKINELIEVIESLRDRVKELEIKIDPHYEG